MAADVLSDLAETIRARRASDPSKSYTQQLLSRGSAVCARKFGEEAVELIVAALSDDASATTAEAADVLYHLLVLLESKGIAYANVLKTLDGRSGTSGVEEKTRRGVT
jgi:phosphoribosyl-ATP pyrophosphohydrolase